MKLLKLTCLASPRSFYVTRQEVDVTEEIRQYRFAEPMFTRKMVKKSEMEEIQSKTVDSHSSVVRFAFCLPESEERIKKKLMSRVSDKVKEIHESASTMYQNTIK